MDTAIQMFKFENNQEIRVVQGDDGEPWFVALDLCKALDLANPADVVGALDEDERNTVVFSEGIPGNPNKIVVSESGLYTLVIRSNKPEARRFRRWVTSEVIPAIRKTGSYSITPPTPPTPASVVLAMAQAMFDLESRVSGIDHRVSQIETTQQVAQATLLELPPPTTAAPEKSLRAALNENVRAYAQKTSIAFPDVWSKLYRELKYRASFDAPTRSKHTRKSTLDLVEEAGLLPELYAIAREVLI